MGLGSTGGDTLVIEVWLLSGIARFLGVVGDGVVLKVNHMGWYRLRARVTSIKSVVC